MNEQFIRIYSLPKNLYQHGSPLLISAGALLKDCNTGRMIVQLKFRNLSKKIIRFVKIKVNAYDTAGVALEGVASFAYVDLSIAQDVEFGSQTPIVLPDDNTRSFGIEILSVIFGDGEQYEPPVDAGVSAAPDAILEPVQRRERRENEKRIARFFWIPLILATGAIICKVLVEGGGFLYSSNSFFKALIESFQRISVRGDLRYWIVDFSLTFLTPCVSIIFYLFSKKKSRICYIGFLVALFCSICYSFDVLPRINRFFVGKFYLPVERVLGVLSVILALIADIASTVILFLLTGMKQGHEKKGIAPSNWIPLFIGVGAILSTGGFYLSLRCFTFPLALVKSFKSFGVKAEIFFGNWLVHVLACLLIPCITIVCSLFSKKNSRFGLLIRCFWILVALCYTVFYTCQKWRLIIPWISFGLDSYFLILILPIIENIASAVILFLQTRKSKDSISITSAEEQHRGGKMEIDQENGEYKE